ncbi:MAG TPA: antibiotic biosynthesis monooxygenase [Steroidobacteraceae bacterium]|jgi:antibiotic biosynthesis monooxygenase (ABM) superfamily enzyme|nr:antibiotic biosynthesis monooxygenase [Steroidobacteraceae bacterium]
MPDEPVTVVVRRRVKPGSEAAFESAMQEFIGFALGFPGNRGIHVVRPGANSREYTVVDQFIDGQARQSFKASSDYGEWMRRLRELSESDPYIEEQSGLGGWFTPPEAVRASPPAQVKMALVTFLGVLPLTAALPPLFAWLLPGWHPQLANVLVTALIVTLLTWPVMPLLTRLFALWLYGKTP